MRLDRRSLVAAGAGLALALGSPRIGLADTVRSQDTINRIIRRMTLEEKIGQMFIIQAYEAAMTDWYREMLLTVQPGGVLFFGYNVGSNDQVRTYIEAIQRTGRYAPPLVAVDQEGGPVTRVPGDPVPGATQLGRMTDREVRRYSIDRGKFLREWGFNVNFAPVADIAYSPSSSMVSRSFGSDPETVSSKIVAVVSGSRRARLASAVKHFPGHGRTSIDSHSVLPVVDISLDEWMKSDAVPFQSAIAIGVEMVMFAHLQFPQWDSAPTSLSKVSVDILRNELGFKGVALTDDLVMGAMMNYSPYDLVEESIAAGMDMVMYTSSPVPFTDLIAYISERVRAKALDETEINKSVKRILLLKSIWFPHLALPL